MKRLLSLATYLALSPRELVSLTALSHRMGVAKSTLSEDLVVVKEALEDNGLGRIESQVGAQGGVVFEPELPWDLVAETAGRWCRALAEKDRMTPDGFLYVTDVLFSPRWIDPMGMLLAYRFRHVAIDFIATVETRGIPLALSSSRHLGVDTILLRRDNRLSEGSSLSINYLSGSSRRVQSMSLARRSPVRGGRVLFVDDFMQAGGTARAATDLLGEVGAHVVGVGVLITTSEPVQKLVDEYASLLTWDRGAGTVALSGWVDQLLRTVPVSAASSMAKEGKRTGADPVSPSS